MATVTLRPVADLVNYGMKDQDFGNTDLYSVVDEVVADDGDYITTAAISGEEYYVLWQFGSHGIAAGSTINSLTIYVRHNDVSIGSVNIYIYSNTSGGDSEVLSITMAYTTHSLTYNTNPLSSSAWTVSDLNLLCSSSNELMAGVSTIYSNISQYYIVVDYTEASSAYKKFGTITWSSVKKIAGVVEANIKKLGKITKLI
ncbi:MAG: hypothetical protein PHS33_07975 [Candidatus Omnitrophica bacterium]|nr:hypothetical protein [Candidatus Omnitrophota bacterium]